MINLPDPISPICKEIFDKTEDEFKNLSSKLKINNISDVFFKEIVIPLAIYLNSLKKSEKPMLIGLTGGQGSGKTTLSEFVQLTLRKGFNKKTVGFSIDDIYKTRKERKELGKTIHPLCEVRGVPGTHNVQLGLDTIDSLYKAQSTSITSIPIFSKLMDQHLPKEDWLKYDGKPDFIFFDGWFCGARPISEIDWRPPLNKLEEEEDPNGVWSKWYNKELSDDYQTLFSKFDLLLMIKECLQKEILKQLWLD